MLRLLFADWCTQQMLPQIWIPLRSTWRKGRGHQQGKGDVLITRPLLCRGQPSSWITSECNEIYTSVFNIYCSMFFSILYGYLKNQLSHFPLLLFVSILQFIFRYLSINSSIYLYLSRCVYLSTHLSNLIFLSGCWVTCPSTYLYPSVKRISISKCVRLWLRKIIRYNKLVKFK